MAHIPTRSLPLARRRRGLLRLFAAVLGGGSLVGALAQAAQEPPPVVIRFSHVVAEDTPKGQMALRFQARLLARSGGQMRVEVYPRASLYGDRDEIEALRHGAVEVLAPSLSKFGRMGFPEFELFDLPFLFAGEADVHRLMQGALGKALLQRLQRQQMVGLGFLDNGFKHMSANRPLLEPGDYAGLRMRVQSSRTIARQMHALGVRPVTLPFSETWQALRTGVVGGTENPVSNFWTQRMNEVQSDLTLTQHGYLGYAVVVGLPFWNGLTPEQRAMVQGALQDALAWGNGIAAGQNAQALAELRADGTTRVHALSAEQRGRLRAAVQPAYDDLERRIGRRWMDAAREAVGGD